MEPMYYIVKQIDGDYAHLQRLLADGSLAQEDKLVARALLPEQIQEGMQLVYEWLQYRIAG